MTSGLGIGSFDHHDHHNLINFLSPLLQLMLGLANLNAEVSRKGIPNPKYQLLATTLAMN